MTQVPIPPEVAAILRSRNKIEAIKRLRELTGFGLKEAKEWIEAHERGADPGPLPSLASAARDPSSPFTRADEVVEVLRKGNKMHAIKLVRETTGVGLAEAKDIAMEIYKAMREGGSTAAAARATALLAKDGSQRFTARPSASESHRAQGLAPGEVPRGGGAGKWIALILIAIVGITVALYFSPKG